MKNIYMAPTMEEIKIETRQMIATSVGKGEGNINPNDVGAPSLDIPSSVFDI